jgi:hypothetical protein
MPPPVLVMMQTFPESLFDKMFLPDWRWAGLAPIPSP